VRKPSKCIETNYSFPSVGEQRQEIDRGGRAACGKKRAHDQKKWATYRDANKGFYAMDLKKKDQSAEGIRANEGKSLYRIASCKGGRSPVT